MNIFKGRKFPKRMGATGVFEPSICAMALELFKNNPNSLTLDFRHLFRRYQEVFGTYKPRCILSETGIPVQ